MKIVKTKSIAAKDVSEIIEEQFVNFKDRAKLHKGNEIPDFFVYIQDYAWNAFFNHGNSVYERLRHEAQGIFVGNYFKDQFGEFVVATAYEEGDGYSQSAYVEMSEECLAEISEKCQNDETLMLIWVHTHPNFGVFYSGTDYNCLKTNFYKPYQIGIVVDILRKQDKGFKTKGNDVVEFSDYVLFSQEKNILFPPFGKIEDIQKNEQTDVLNNEYNKLYKEYDQLKKEYDHLKKENELLKKNHVVKSNKLNNNKKKRRNSKRRK